MPSGTLTFLFSDIEGSTRLVQEIGPAVFTDILERHNAILRAAFGAHRGTERGTQGDSFLVMFTEAPAAVAAAAEAQVALAQEAWPADADVRVRMGLHTGLGTLGGDDYVGLDVNRAARISSAAHGGQVLISDSTRALTTDALPAGVTLRRLGEHRLKDVTQPEVLHQLVIDGVPSEFPPIRTHQRSAGNLPARLTSFIGREAEIAELAGLLEQNRLITLTGPGGTGKTSLAVEFGRSRVADFEGGVWFVPLDTVADPSIVPRTIAAGIGLIDGPDMEAARRLAAFFEDRSALLILDNFEQVVQAAPLIVDLLQASPRLKVIVTSRSPLRLGAEQEYPVAPLSVGGRGATGDDERQADAVRLFIERAGRVLPGYQPASEDVTAIEEICRRLDGLPLGIELAASRVAILPPRSLAQRLAGRLDLPGAGSRDVPERQRSLEGAIAWSHDLLEPAERRLLARLSIFAGGCRLSEAEAICGPESDLGVDVLEGLSRLIDHSLVQPAPGLDGARFRLLETIRVFAAIRLADGGDAATIGRRHALAYRDLAELAARHLPGRDQLEWLDRLSAEHDNLRAALRWAIDNGDAETALRLGAGLWRFWQLRGHMTEGQEAITEILRMPGAAARTEWRMRALEAAGGLQWWSADLAGGDASYAAQLEVAREIGDPRGIADALFNLVHTRLALGGDSPELDRMRDKAIALYRQLGDERSIERTKWTATYASMTAGRGQDSRDAILTVLERFEELGDDFYVAIVSGALGGIAFADGDVPRAMRWGIGALVLQHRMGDVASTTLALLAMAVGLVSADQAPEAAVVYGRFEALSRRHGYQPPVNPVEWFSLGLSGDQLSNVVRDHVEEVRRGAEMTTDEVIEFIVRVVEDRWGPPPSTTEGMIEKPSE
jgi:predicted ATPase/class 3 adenylate cyclase